MNSAESPGCNPRVPLKNYGKRNVNMTKYPVCVKLPIQHQLSRSPRCEANNIKTSHHVVNYTVKLEATVNTKPQRVTLTALNKH